MPFALLFAAFALVLDLLHAVTRRRRDLAVEVVVLRQQVRMYQRNARRPPLSRLLRLSARLAAMSGAAREATRAVESGVAA
jgi:hypothetical protein